MPLTHSRPNPGDHVVFLVMRRMRAPLIVMIVITAISVLGMVLIPGVDEHGRPYHMSFFEAFYFISFMTTTIGFGEIPHAFTPEQRFWVTLCIYPTVIGWLYAFGSILSLMQDEGFKRTLFHAAFARHVRNLTDAFCLVCGYGATGQLLVERMTREYRQCVVIDIDQDAINELVMEDLNLFVPGLGADAADSEHLIKAGLKHPNCAAVAAVTNDDRANLKVAMNARLLHPDIPVVARADHEETAANMRAFGVHHVINPYAIFAEDIAEAMRMPAHFRFRARLMEGDDPAELAERLASLADAPWILCGFGRLGRMIYERLAGEGVRFAVVDAFPDRNHPPEGAIIGRGMEEPTLREAGIERAGGIIAATDDDMDNLSIILAARRLNPGVFTIARQVRRANQAMFDAARIDMIMQCNRLVARNAHSWIATPLLHDFADGIARLSDRTVERLMKRIANKTSSDTFETWQARLDGREAPAVETMLAQGAELRLGHLMRDPWRPAEALPQIALLAEHAGREWVLPGPSLPLQRGMNILFCGRQTTGWRAAIRQPEALAWGVAHAEGDWAGVAAGEGASPSS